MKHKKDNDTYLLKLEKGEEVIESITQFCTEHGIHAASISGIGAVESTRLAYYNVPSSSYLESRFPNVYEVLSLLGNVSLKEGTVFPHIHITLGDNEFRTIGGHLMEATVAVTLELFITPLPTPLERELDGDVNLHLWKCD